MFRQFLAILIISVFGFSHTIAQADLLHHKTIGVYISSKTFSYPDEFYLPISQFLTLDDDRSWVGQMKAEFMIRLGWMYIEQLQALAQADTVYFLNAELGMGKAFQQIYDVENNIIGKPGEELAELDMVLVINPFTIQSRMHKSVFIRSNRMITERVPIKTCQFTVTLYDLHNLSLTLPTSICIDNQKSPNPAWHFDFHLQKSSMGKFLSKCFSQWWAQMLTGERNNCE